MEEILNSLASMATTVYRHLIWPYGYSVLMVLAGCILYLRTRTFSAFAFTFCKLAALACLMYANFSPIAGLDLSQFGASFSTSRLASIALNMTWYFSIGAGFFLLVFALRFRWR